MQPLAGLEEALASRPINRLDAARQGMLFATKPAV
jgi:hypothetical protein